MPRACSMSAVVKPPMPPPTMMTFMAQLAKKYAHPSPDNGSRGHAGATIFDQRR
jgi:hypothetical protein